MILRNEDGTIYKLDTNLAEIEIPTLPSSSELKPLEDKVDRLKKSILEIEEVINYILKKG